MYWSEPSCSCFTLVSRVQLTFKKCMHISLFQQSCFKANLPFLGIDHSWFYRGLVPNLPHASTPEPNFFTITKKRANTIPVSKISDSLPWLPCQKPSTHSLHSATPCSSCTDHPPSHSLFLSLALCILPSHQLQMCFSLFLWIIFIFQPSFYNHVVTQSHTHFHVPASLCSS